MDPASDPRVAGNAHRLEPKRWQSIAHFLEGEFPWWSELYWAIQLILDAARDAAIDCKTAPEPEPEPEPEPGGTMLHCNALPEGTPPPKRHAGYVRKDSGSR